MTTSKQIPRITQQQSRVLDLCRTYVERNGRFPDREWIREQMGWEREQSVYDALLGLTGNGYLAMSVKGRKRVFRLAASHESELS